jgi:hypothetical protein
VEHLTMPFWRTRDEREAAEAEARERQAAAERDDAAAAERKRKQARLEVLRAIDRKGVFWPGE